MFSELEFNSSRSRGFVDILVRAKPSARDEPVQRNSLVASISSTLVKGEDQRSHKPKLEHDQGKPDKDDAKMFAQKNAAEDPAREKY
jgi:hypothetical protein